MEVLLYIPEELKPFSHEIISVNKIDNGYLLSIVVHHSTPAWLTERIAEMSKRFHLGRIEVKRQEE